MKTTKEEIEDFERYIEAKGEQYHVQGKITEAIPIGTSYIAIVSALSELLMRHINLLGASLRGG